MIHGRRKGRKGKKAPTRKSIQTNVAIYGYGRGKRGYSLGDTQVAHVLRRMTLPPSSNIFPPPLSLLLDVDLSKVVGMQMLFLGEVGAEELMRPYRGVVRYHADAVRHLKSGPCVALKIEASRRPLPPVAGTVVCGASQPENLRLERASRSNPSSSSSSSVLR